MKPTIVFADLFDCEVVISMVPDDAAVRDVVFGQEDAGIGALASILHAKDMDFDAVIELVDDDRALLARIEKRAQESIARGGGCSR